ncbi:MAG: M3 family oligoendopeptidase [Bacteroidetes bacterium]|nr:M3 family oligoendopeptidase [Bacteroidota bacterium]
MKFSEFPFYIPDINIVRQNFRTLFRRFSESNSFEEQHKYFLEINEGFKDYSTLWGIARIRYSLDMNSEENKKNNLHFDNSEPQYSAIEKEFDGLFLQSQFRSEYDKIYGSNLSRTMENDFKLYTDDVAEDIKEESRIEIAYSELRGKAMVKFDGKEITFSELDEYLSSTDREVRKKANEVYWKFFEENNDSFCKLLDDIVKVRTRLAKKLGFKNFVELAYARLDKEYSPQDALKFTSYLHKHVVPLSFKLLQRQSARIGIDKLKYYDTALRFKSGNAKPAGNPEWITEQAKKMYHELSPETGEFINFMINNELLNIYPQKGKEEGGFCAYLQKHKSPFIFANMNGTDGDVDVLTHEAGHALQKYLCRNYAIPELINITPEVGEIHSMAMEFLTYDYMHIFFGEDVNKYFYSHQESFVRGCLTTALVNEFQNEIYEKPELTIDERNILWRNLQKKYNPVIDYDGNEYLESGHTWQNRSLIFEIPFYDIDYALAQFCAYQFFFRSKLNFKKTFREYLDFCKLGGRYTFSESLKITGLKSPFEEETIIEMIMEVEKFMESIDDSKF